MIELKIKPQLPGIIKGRNNELYALVKATGTGDQQNIGESPPLNLAIVIDRSGSMAGVPLEEAKKSAIFIIDKLRATDRVAIITYDTFARVLIPTQQCINKAAIVETILSINPGGSTDLHGGWLLGAEEVARHKSANSLNRVLLLSDGNANSGETSRQIITEQCSELANVGIITSTYGLGYSFNEALMIDMARSGLGQGYYGETAEDLLDPFQEEFDLLTKTIAWNLKLKAEAPSFVKFKLMNKFKPVQGTSDRWHLPDIAEGGDAWALFKLEIDEVENQIGPIEVLRCSMSYQTKVEGNTVIERTDPVKLIIDRVDPNAHATFAEDEEVKRRLDEILIANLQDEARRASIRGNWVRVDEIILRAKTIAGTDEWLQGSLDELQRYAKLRRRDEFSKGAMYNSDKMHRRLSSDTELGSMAYNVSEELDKHAYLRRKMNRGKRMPRN